MLTSHLHLGLPSGLFPSGFSTKTLYTSLSYPIHVTCLAHLILLGFITRTILGEKYRSFQLFIQNYTPTWPYVEKLFRKHYIQIKNSSQFRGIYIRNNLIRIGVPLIWKLSGTPDYGATAPRSPFSLPFILSWICWTPPKNIPGYATDIPWYLLHLQIEWNPWLGGYRPQIPVLSALCP
jgi:hypothetical protein